MLKAQEESRQAKEWARIWDQLKKTAQKEPPMSLEDEEEIDDLIDKTIEAEYGPWPKELKPVQHLIIKVPIPKSCTSWNDVANAQPQNTYNQVYLYQNTWKLEPDPELATDKGIDL